MRPDWRSLRHRLASLLLGAALAMGWTGPAARAEAGRPALEVLGVGWDGHVTQGTWAPVRVRLTGAAEDREAVVEVVMGERYEPEPGKTARVPNAAYGQEVFLPAHDSKEVTLWVPSTRGLFGTVRLRAGEEELASAEIEMRPTKAAYWPLIGLFSDQDGLFADLGRITMPLQNLPTPVHVARLTAGMVPEQAERLRACGRSWPRGTPRRA